MAPKLCLQQRGRQAWVESCGGGAEGSAPSGSFSFLSGLGSRCAAAGVFLPGPRNGRGRAQAALGTNGSEPEASFLAVLSLETWEAVMGCFSSLG